LGDQTENEEVGGACSIHGRDENFIPNIWYKNVKVRDHWKELGLDGRYSKWILKE
jgi:hypothetical protein